MDAAEVDPWALFDDDDDAGGGGDAHLKGSASAPNPPPSAAFAASDTPDAVAQGLLSTILQGFFSTHLQGAVEDIAVHGPPTVRERGRAVAALLKQAAAAVSAVAITLRRRGGSSGAASAPATWVALEAPVTLIAEAAWTLLRAEGAWPHVAWREAFVLAQLAAGTCALVRGDPQRGMHCIDLALIMGAPADEIRGLVHLVEAHVMRGGVALGGGAWEGLPNLPPVSVEELPIPPLPPRARAIVRVAATGGRHSSPLAAADEEVALMAEHPSLRAARAVTDHAVPPLSPSAFLASARSTSATPLVLVGAIRHWQALRKWRALGPHWVAAHGHRTVPIELGHHLSSGSGGGGQWSEEPMLLREFVTNYLAPSLPPTVAYLAQHALFEQLEGLDSDCEMTEYAGDGVGSVNAWIGTRGTITRAHFDSYDNLLHQVCGYKIVRLFAPSDTPFLYPIRPNAEGGDATTAQGNVSAVDVAAPDLERFPEHERAVAWDALLGPGDVLFIPRGWWHYVRSLTTSMSVNAWW